jgi:CRISPR type III-A-associated protein Csm2
VDHCARVVGILSNEKLDKMTELSLKSTQNIDAKAKEWGEKYVENDVTTNQLRQIYSEVKRAQNEFRFENNIEKARRTLVLLKPRLAYSASRNDGMEIVKDDFSKWIDLAVRREEKYMELFFQLMEATVAYHAYFGEKGGGQ